MSDLGWSRYIREIEDGNMQACIECAKANGYTAEQADNCDAGDLDCKCCPWGGKEEANE